MAITEQALSRFEELQLESEKKPSAPLPSTKKKIDLLSELDQLPPPPTDTPKGVSKSASLPRGWHNHQLNYVEDWL